MSASKNLNNLITDNLDIWTTAIQSKNRTGRGSNKTYELYGIKKLRALILDLAVRGLLVPQDHNDEPASVLLEKIKAEKERLIKEGKIKKQKVLPEISEEEKPFKLPKGWEWEKLGNFIYLEMGQSPPSKYYNQEGKGMPFFQGKADFGEKYPTPRYWCVKPQKYSYKNDVLLSVRAPVGPTNISNINCCIGRGLAALRPILDVPTMYIDCLLKGFRSNLESFATGTTFAAVSKVVVDNLLISIAPLKEQKRIVAKVDELMTLCDQLEQQTDTSIKAHKLLVENLLNALTEAKDHNTFQQAWQRIAQHFDTLFTTYHSIDQLKQTILQLAVMGKLVPQNPNDEPASELLKKIAKEKEQLIKEGKIKKQKALPEISDDEKPFELPDGWEFVRFANLAIRMGSGATPRGGKNAYVDKGIPFLRSQNIRNSGLKMFDVAYITDEIHKKMSNTTVYPNDLLLNITGGSLGRSTIFPDMYEVANVSQHVSIIRLFSQIDVQFMHLCILSPHVQKMIWSRQVGMAREGLSKKVMEQFEIPLPPLKEQLRIVSKIEELMAICNQMKSQITSSKKIQTKIADTLTQL